MIGNIYNGCSIIPVKTDDVVAILTFRLVVSVKPVHKVLISNTPSNRGLQEYLIRLICKVATRAPHLDVVSRLPFLCLLFQQEDWTEWHELGIVAGINYSVKFLQIYLDDDLAEELVDPILIVLCKEIKVSISDFLLERLHHSCLLTQK